MAGLLAIVISSGDTSVAGVVLRLTFHGRFRIMVVRLRLSRHIVLLFAALLFLVVINAVWLYLDHSVPAWDDAYYITNSLRTYDALTDNGLLGFGRQFLRGMSTKPPLIAALPTPIYLMVGRHPRAALLVNLAFLLVTLATTYLLARAFAGRSAGLVALCIVGTIPMVYGLSRIFLVECGLTALVTLALYILACADTDASWAPCILGAIFGLGLLMKTSFPVYVAGPMAWILIQGGRATIRLRRIGACLVPLLMIAGPWYTVNASAALLTALAAGSADTARAYQTGGLAQTRDYFVNLMNCGPRLYFVALPILAILCIGRLSAPCRRGMLFCFAAALPIVFLSVSHYRDLRYAAPIFPVIAVAVGILATASISRFPRAAIVVILLLAAGTADMLDATFGFTTSRFEGGGLLLSIPRFSYVRPPQRVPSPYLELLTEMQRRGRWMVGVPHRLVLASDTVTVNADTVTLTALAARIPLEVATTAYASSAGLPQLLASASYFAYVDNAADSPFNSLGRAAITLVRGDPHFRELMSATLPDGSHLHVLEALEPPSEQRLTQSGALAEKIDAPPDCSIRFADGIELTGLSVQRVPSGIEARYRWHSWRRIPRNYWSFGHILDAQGRVLAYLDHPILPQTPSSQWEVGDSGIEKVVVRISATGSAVPQAVRLGVFDRETGDRVPVLSSMFPLADASTSTVVPIN